MDYDQFPQLKKWLLSREHTPELLSLIPCIFGVDKNVEDLMYINFPDKPMTEVIALYSHVYPIRMREIYADESPLNFEGVQNTELIDLYIGDSPEDRYLIIPPTALIFNADVQNEVHLQSNFTQNLIQAIPLHNSKVGIDICDVCRCNAANAYNTGCFHGEVCLPCSYIARACPLCYRKKHSKSVRRIVLSTSDNLREKRFIYQPCGHPNAMFDNLNCEKCGQVRSFFDTIVFI
jgi:hypothetical protein